MTHSPASVSGDSREAKSTEYVETLIAESVQKAKQRGFPTDQPDFSQLSDQEFEQHKQNSIRTYAYTKRIYRILQQYSDNTHICLAFFDADCCLMRLFGAPDALKFAASQKIRVATNWGEDALGPNAVSIGTQQQCVVRSVASQNYSSLLSGVSIYFAPYILESESGTLNFIKQVQGGIAILAEKGYEQENYLLTAACMANDICLHLYMAENYQKLHSSEPIGIICFDIDTDSGKPHILYHNARLFKVLNIPEQILYFKDVSTLFDPLPKNKELWDLVHSPRSMEPQSMKLCAHGVERQYKVSCEYYHQASLRVQGLRITINSVTQFNSYISKEAGNIAKQSFYQVIGESPAFVNTVERAKLMAQNDSNLLIIGESGSGKDIIAQSIHNASNRCNNPFVAINCAAFSRDLIASELFGYADGAFTGARKGGTIGKFQLANSGTLFLDEIGDMPLELQAVLLRIIEQKQFTQVGGQNPISVDVRIIAATNVNLEQKMRQKQFREDLYFRLGTLKLTIPPLRERKEDILPLAEHFIEHICLRLNRPPLLLSPESKQLLLSLPWKGNIRELQNVMESCVILCYNDLIQPSDIYENISYDTADAASTQMILSAAKPSGRQPISQEDILSALQKNGNNRTKAAETLRISRKTFYRWLERYHMN